MFHVKHQGDFLYISIFYFKGSFAGDPAFLG